MKTLSSRDYTSIDDLSPEYTVLPFVKRLKILNERQKIAELERALTVVRSASVDGGSGASGGSSDLIGSTSGATISKSEANVSTRGMSPPGAYTPLVRIVSAPLESITTATTQPETYPESSDPRVDEVPSSNDSTAVQEAPAEYVIAAAGEDLSETPERVNLKKILKTLSRHDVLHTQSDSSRMKLLRSQTVEGYAVRHANFTQLAGRQKGPGATEAIARTLPSPPKDDINIYSTNSAPLDEITGALITTASSDEQRTEPESFAEPLKPQLSIASKEECVTELLHVVKAVLQNGLVRSKQMICKFQAG